MRAFEDWDVLAEVDQTWIELRRIIQEAFQCCLNAMVPTSGHQGYDPVLPYMTNNAFGALGQTANNKDDDSANTVATQMVALTLQSQLMVNTAANMLQRQDQLYQQLTHQQTLLHANQHQI